MVTGMTGDRARSALEGSLFADLRWVGETGLHQRRRAGARPPRHAGGSGRGRRPPDRRSGEDGAFVGGPARFVPPHVGAAQTAARACSAPPAHDGDGAVGAGRGTRARAGGRPVEVAERPGGGDGRRAQEAGRDPGRLGSGCRLPGGRGRVGAERRVAGGGSGGAGGSGGGPQPPELGSGGPGSARGRDPARVRASLRGSSARDGGHAALLEQYERSCSSLGCRVRVELPAERFEGTAVGITPQGHLVVETDGLPREVAAGDVVHLR